MDTPPLEHDSCRETLPVLMLRFRFDNRFVRELPADPLTSASPRAVLGALFSRVAPTAVAAPRLVAYSREVAALLDLDETTVQSQEFAQVFGGNAVVGGMEPYAANYGGHQFGHWAGQLGDGRALTLGEIINSAGQRWELQLKGAGPTPYSRRADGRAVLRSSIREFLCSEAMHHLGVPTTRALCLVATGEGVMRDMFYDGRPRIEPGAIVCRVAPSFIRLGNFELPASRNDIGLLRQLVAFTIDRDFPWLVADGRAAGDPDVVAAWFAEICERTARMIVEWMRVGFVHGVMNTDNLSVLGLTLDYGPYGWIDNFDPNWTPNTTDAGGRRYRFGQQPDIAYWNLEQLANALLPLLEQTRLREGLQHYVATFSSGMRDAFARKLGLASCTDDDVDLMHDVQELLERGEVDMTVFFRRLAALDPDAPSLAPLHVAFYDEAKRTAEASAFQAWLGRYVSRLASDPLTRDERRRLMDAANPQYVLRNYLAQQAIDRAEQGDESEISRLLELLRRPYDEQPDHAVYADRRPDWARHRAGCSMLSCSS